MAKTPTPRKPTKSISRAQLHYLSHEAILEEAGPSGLSSWAIGLIIFLLAILVGWSNYVVIQTSATTEGTVTPTGNERVVQHLEGGIVKSIKVREGDLVRAGESVLQFEPTLRTAELNQMRSRAAALNIKIIRLKAFLTESEPDFSRYAFDYPDLVEDQLFGLQSHRESIAGQIAVLETRIDQRRKSVDIFKKQASSLEKQLKLVEESVKMRKNLFESGHGSRVNLINTQLELAKVQGSLTEAEVSMEQAEASIAEAESQIFEIKVKEKDKARQELAETTASLSEIQENLERLEDKVNRLDVLAPVDGMVQSMSVNTPGAVVEPAQVLMTIIPISEKVIIENRILPRDIGHLSIGQKTKITVSGFDARRYGTIDGTLVQVSPSTFLDERGQPYFKGHIELDSQFILGKGTQQRVVPGMTVQANIITGSQTLLEYLTRPVYVALVNAFSER